MDNIVGTLQLGWKALLFQEEAYEEMRTSASPVVKGLLLIVVVGVVIALLALFGDIVEWAGTPDLGKIQDTVYSYVIQMPGFQEAMRADPQFAEIFQMQWDMNWQIANSAVGGSLGAAVSGLITTPLGLIIRWLIYGLLAYVFARWLGGTGNLAETLGVLALAVAPQALKVLQILPYVEVGNIVGVWGVLVAYMGLKTAHKLTWPRTVWATLLPFILVVAILFALACLGVGIMGAVIGGLS